MCIYICMHMYMYTDIDIDIDIDIYLYIHIYMCGLLRNICWTHRESNEDLHIVSRLWGIRFRFKVTIVETPCECNTFGFRSIVIGAASVVYTFF